MQVFWHFKTVGGIFLWCKFKVSTAVFFLLGSIIITQKCTKNYYSAKKPSIIYAEHIIVPNMGSPKNGTSWSFVCEIECCGMLQNFGINPIPSKRDNIANTNNGTNTFRFITYKGSLGREELCVMTFEMNHHCDHCDFYFPHHTFQPFMCFKTEFFGYLKWNVPVSKALWVNFCCLNGL